MKEIKKRNQNDMCHRCDDIDTKLLFEKIREERIEELLQCLDRENINKAYDSLESIKMTFSEDQKRAIEVFFEELVDYEAYLSDQIYYHGFCDGIKVYKELSDMKAKLLGKQKE